MNHRNVTLIYIRHYEAHHYPEKDPINKKLYDEIYGPNGLQQNGLYGEPLDNNSYVGIDLIEDIEKYPNLFKYIEENNLSGEIYIHISW